MCGQGWRKAKRVCDKTTGTGEQKISDGKSQSAKVAAAISHGRSALQPVASKPVRLRSVTLPLQYSRYAHFLVSFSLVACWRKWLSQVGKATAQLQSHFVRYRRTLIGKVSFWAWNEKDWG